VIPVGRAQSWQTGITDAGYSMRQIRGERIQKILIALDKISIWRRLEYKRP